MVLTSATFPIYDNRTRNRRVNGLEPCCEFLLSDPLLLAKIANAVSDRIMNFRVHT